MAEFIALDRIRLDGGTQPRAQIFHETVDAYAEDMKKGDPFPPIVLFFDGADYWLADGFHRFAAAQRLCRGGLNALVRQGTQRDAVLYSVGVNADHGRPRTVEDKRRAVQRLLDDPEWSTWSDREIARHCRVDGKTVAALRPAASADTAEFRSMERTFVHPKTGAPTVMNTANIGRRSERAAEDRPVFDQTPAAAGLTRAPAPQPAPTVEQIDPTWANRATVSDPIFEIVERVQRLPTPVTAAQRFPRSLAHSLTTDDVRAVAAWFAEFAEAWAHTNGEVHAAAE